MIVEYVDFHTHGVYTTESKYPNMLHLGDDVQLYTDRVIRGTVVERIHKLDEDAMVVIIKRKYLYEFADRYATKAPIQSYGYTALDAYQLLQDRGLADRLVSPMMMDNPMLTFPILTGFTPLVINQESIASPQRVVGYFRQMP